MQLLLHNTPTQDSDIQLGRTGGVFTAIAGLLCSLENIGKFTVGA
jgi:hypothetical protein